VKLVLRNFRQEDEDKIREIHKRHYEFPLPDWNKNFIIKFVAEEDGEIVLAGGLKAITEAVLVTDLDKSVRARRRALLDALQCMILSANHYKLDQIHAFIKAIDVDWKEHLKEQGFVPCESEALVLNI
jgi:hypothetical protein